jgi:hypothetical protein
MSSRNSARRRPRFRKSLKERSWKGSLFQASSRFVNDMLRTWLTWATSYESVMVSIATIVVTENLN